MEARYNRELKGGFVMYGGGFHRVKTVSPVIARSEYHVKWADGTTSYMPANDFEYSPSAKKQPAKKARNESFNLSSGMDLRY